jgi:glutathione S-transferase
MPPREEPMKIYGVPLSVHTRKVILSARIKSIPYVSVPVVPVVPDNPPSNWRSISPTGLIPAIDDGGYVLADSTAIVLYLERRSEEPALLPRDPSEYGRALFLDSWAGSELFRRVIHPIFRQQVVAPRIRKERSNDAVIAAALEKAAPEAFAYLEGRHSSRHHGARRAVGVLLSAGSGDRRAGAPARRLHRRPFGRIVNFSGPLRSMATTRASFWCNARSNRARHALDVCARFQSRRRAARSPPP